MILPPGWSQVLGTPSGLLDGRPVRCEWRRDLASNRCALIAVQPSHMAGFVFLSGGIQTTSRFGVITVEATIKLHTDEQDRAFAAVPRVCAALDVLVEP